MDRIIKMINFINSNHNKSFHELSTKHQKQVLIINFDRYVFPIFVPVLVMKIGFNTNNNPLFIYNIYIFY